MEDASLVPARMINEVLYCPRLMYLEWVHGEWADNVFTIDGNRVHRRADAGKGDLPEPGTEGPVVARSVWLSSERLNITAKIDLVEGDGDVVSPVEFKRGKRARTPEQVYLPERAQLCAQVLLLREHGYRCTEGVVYFARERVRVTVPIVRTLVEITLRAVRRALALAETQQVPPPFVGSRKCVGCSLSAICLPDEIALLQGEDGGVRDCEPTAIEVRQLVPSRDDKESLYVQEQGAKVGLSKMRLTVKSPDGEKRGAARLPNTSQVNLYGNVQVSTQALRELMKRGIPVNFFTSGGWYCGRIIGMESKNAHLRIAQHRLVERDDQCLRLARGIVCAKILNARTFLRRNSRSVSKETVRALKEGSERARAATSLESLLGFEGTAARMYFGEFGALFKDNGAAFRFENRNRRPPRDPVNAMLSLAYALLTKDVSIAVRSAGLDAMIGFFHRPRHGRPALALDLMEEFRPLIADSVVVRAVNTGVVQDGDFLVRRVGTALTTQGRRKFIGAYERRMSEEVTHPVFGYRISYRRVLEVQARLFARHVLGEISAYPSFQTR